MNAMFKKAYLEATIAGSGIDQVIMLYDKAISCIQQAAEAIKNKNIETRYNKLERAFKIVSGLRDALDFSQGEDISKTLAEWYDGVALRIISINKSESIDMCDLCIDNLKTMRDAWAELDYASKAVADADVPVDKGFIAATSQGKFDPKILQNINLEI